MFKFNSYEWHKMNRAFMIMKASSSNQNRYFDSVLYESRKKAFSIVHSQSQTGTGNSQYGTVWIHSLNQRISKRIKISEFETYITSGWTKGRIVNFEAHDKRIVDIAHEIQKRKSKKQKKIDFYSEYHNLYKHLGWKQFVIETGYQYSQINLVNQFKKYVKEFIPQNGRKR